MLSGIEIAEDSFSIQIAGVGIKTFLFVIKKECFF